MRKQEPLVLTDVREGSLRISQLAAPEEQFRKCFGARRDVEFGGPLAI
jgi:hypothetical protein